MSLASICTSAGAACAAFLATNIDDFLILVLCFGRTLLPGSSTTSLDVFLGNALGFLVILALSAAGVALGMLVPLPYVKLLGLLPLLMGLNTLQRRLRKALLRRAQRLAAEAQAAAQGSQRALLAAENGEEEGEEAGSSSSSSSSSRVLDGEKLQQETQQEAQLETQQEAQQETLPQSQQQQRAEAGAPSHWLSVALSAVLRPGVASTCVLTVGGGAEEVSVYLPLLATPCLPCLLCTVAVLAALLLLWQLLAYALVRQQQVAKAVEDWGEAAEPWLLLGLGLWVLLGSVAIPVQLQL
jgi:cadmium resistance protein CadD (predicted permease)